MIQRTVYLSVRASLIIFTGLGRSSKSSTTCFSIRSAWKRPTALRMSSTSSSLALKDPTLLPSINPSTSTFEVFDPANPESVVGIVPLMNGEDAKRAIQRSYDALEEWRDGTTASYRGNLLREWSKLIQKNSEDIAQIMTLESGKPLQESRGEIQYGASFLDFYASEGVRSTGAGGGFLVPTTFTANNDGKTPRGQIMAVQQAIGVTALITPWNFPIAMITRKVGPALAVGCTAVMKPSELTPLTAISLKTLANRAGIPDDVFQLVTTNRELTAEVGTEFCTNENVRKISFTGSTTVGKLLMKLSSDTMKRLSLELGGNAPFVVFGDADIDQAVTAAMAAKFRNSGQTCVCADRFLIHETVYEEFTTKFVEKARQLVLGPGTNEPTTTTGPLIVADAVHNVHEKVQEAIRLGAKCLLGGKPATEIGKQFYEPTILCDVPPNAKIWHTETFGPVAPIRKFTTQEEALQLANDCNVGLASYFCTKDFSTAFNFAKKLEVGIVGVNDGIISTCCAPFGGIKESGLGREGSSLGISEYLETKYIFMNT